MSIDLQFDERMFLELSSKVKIMKVVSVSISKFITHVKVHVNDKNKVLLYLNILFFLFFLISQF